MRPKPIHSVWLLAMGLALPAVLPMARAATLYWDGTSTGPNADGGNGSWNTSSSNTVWDTAATGGTDIAWSDINDAVFGGTRGTVTISNSVVVGSVDFQTLGYLITGGTLHFADGPSPAIRVISTGSIDATIASNIGGFVPLSKTGSGRLTLSGPSSAFSSDLTISQGTVRAGSDAALGSASGDTIVTQAGTLDLNGRNLGFERIRIQGAGHTGKGTLINGHQMDSATVRDLRMTGNATVGGVSRWEIPPSSSFNMGGRTLTKVGSDSVWLRNGSINNPGHIDIKEGSFWFENFSGLNGSPTNTVTVRDKATLGQAGSSVPHGWHPWKAILEDGATWSAASGPASYDTAVWNGPVTLNGRATLDVGHAFTMTHMGMISGTGSFSKTGDGTWILRSHNDYTGGTFVKNGRLILDYDYYDPAVPSVVGAITVEAAGVLELAQAHSLGGEDGYPGVTLLTVNGGLVEITNGGDNNLQTVKLAAGVLRSDSRQYAEGRFVMRPGGSVQTFPADTPSYIRGELDLSGDAQVPFVIGGGHTSHDLVVNAVLTNSVHGRGIAKSGEGSMILNGESLFTGATSVHAGTLLLGKDGELPHSPVTVHNGGRFGTAAAGKTLAALRAEEGSRLILPASVGTTTTITGALDLAGGNFIVAPVLGPDSVMGTHDLVTAEAITGTGTPVLDLSSAYGPTRATGTVAVVGHKLRLTLATTGAGILWNNASAAGAPGGTWDTALENFSKDGNNTTFMAFDSVTFDDSVSPGSPKTISLADNLAPAQVTVSNSTGSYIFSPGGSLVGAGSLVKTGSSDLIIQGTDNYSMTGGVSAGGGVIDFSGKSISIENLTVRDGGELANATVRPATMEFLSGTVSATLTGPAPWWKTTTGTVVLHQDNPLTGPGVILEGTLSLGFGEGLAPTGSIGNGPVQIAAGATLAVKRYGYTYVGNSFSGSGEISLTGGGDTEPFYRLSGDNSSFSGLVRLNNAGLLAGASSLGTAGVTVTGNSVLHLINATVEGAIHLDPAPWAFPRDHLVLNDTVLNGIVLEAGGTSVIKSYSGVVYNDPPLGNHINGSITENGGAASLILHSNFASHRFPLVLSGASHYTGTTTIRGNGGLTRLDGSLGGSSVTVESDATLGGTGSIHAGGSLTFAANGRLLANLSGDPLRVEGNVNLGPSMKVQVDVASPAATPGPLTVLEYTGTLSGDTAQVALKDPGEFRQAVFSFTPGLITLDIGRKALVWKGANGNVWETGATVRRWKSADTGLDEFFFKGDSVTFDDTATSTSISTDWVEPSAVLVDNTMKDLSIGAYITGPTLLTKRGTGTLFLSGGSNYTGGTFIEAGRLEATAKTIGSGPVVVSAGATLAGDVEFSGPLTLQGVLDPGLSSSTASGDIKAGPTTLSGTYRCLLDTADSDTLVVDGDLDLTGSTLELTKAFTGTAHPESFLIAVYTGNLTGSFATVTGMPQDFHLVHDPGHKWLLVKRLPFSSWATSYPGLTDTTPEGDPDSDGMANLVEYVLGGNPGSGNDFPLQSHELTDDKFIFRYKRRDSSLFDTTQYVQYSNSLEGPWNLIGIPTTASSGPDVTVVENADLPDDITVSLPRQPGKMFVRLMVIQK